MPTDAELLQRHVDHRDDRAFAELVQRHLGLVYAAALRRTGGRAHLAEEISQAVFCDLARKAARLVRHPTLTGWLYCSTRYAAIDAMRAEFRRQKITQSLSAMADVSLSPEPSVDWERLQPVIDGAMDLLKDRDREIMLLRYFDGLTFAEVGARLNLTENTARMRAERALEKLRKQLGRVGVTSTSTALGLALANSSFAAVPAGLVASVAAGALSVGPAGGGVGLGTFLLMSKFTAPAVSAALASVLTVVLWTSVVPATTAKELAVLRRENQRIGAALAPGASPDALAAVAEEFASQASAIARAVAQKRMRQAASVAAAIGASGGTSTRASVSPGMGGDAGTHRNRGQATPRDAFMSVAWGSNAGEVGELSKLLWFDAEVRTRALEVWETMPDSIRATHRTPEELFAFIYAADALIAPPPGPDLIERWDLVELRPGRVAMRPPGQTPHYDYHQYQQTPDGWKYVVPEVAVKNMPAVLNNETLAKLGSP